MGGKFLAFALSCAFAFTTSARAETFGEFGSPTLTEEAFDALPPAERARKFELALRTLGIPLEKDRDFTAYPRAGEINSPDVLSIAKYIDPASALRRYLQIEPSRISLFPWFFQVNGPSATPNYEVATGAPSNRDSAELLARLEGVSQTVRLGNGTTPLTGLRVVIDPGHMGTPFWNDLDGKFVKVRGKTVSEGVLTLATGKLLATELEKLGAEVRMTRTDLNPVTAYTWDNFNPNARLADYYYKSLDDWMGKYLALSDSELIRRLPNAPEVRKMRTFAGKVYLFLQEDLDARAKVAEAFHPDVFIDLHFDAQEINALQSKRNDITVYVPGSVGLKETGAKNQRDDATKHLIEVRRWKQSVRLATSLVNTVSKNLGIITLKEADATTVKITDGVFARNIFETKRATTGISTFFESFHYDYVREFPRLTVNDAKSSYHGTRFIYPSRLTGIATGIRDGLLQYFREFQAD